MEIFVDIDFCFKFWIIFLDLSDKYQIGIQIMKDKDQLLLSHSFTLKIKKISYFVLESLFG